MAAVGSGCYLSVVPTNLEFKSQPVTSVTRKYVEIPSFRSPKRTINQTLNRLLTIYHLICSELLPSTFSQA